jgi:hypothetical protein
MRTKVLRSSLWRSVTAPRETVFELERVSPGVDGTGQYRRSTQSLGEVRGALVPLENSLRVQTGPGMDVAADAVIYVRDTWGPFYVGDVLSRSGKRWEVLRAGKWEEVSLQVLEVSALDS